MCYIDDICIPRTRYTLEEFNNKLYSQRTVGGRRISGTVMAIPIGNYNGTRLASTIHDLVQQRYTDSNYPDDDMSCEYDPVRGSIKITATFPFFILSDYRVGLLTTDFGNSLVWVDSDNETSVDLSNLCSINEALRNDASDQVFSTNYESGFIDLLNVHNIFIHSGLGHYSSVGLRGESTIIKQMPVSSSLGYLIMDSVVAAHDKIDVSRQLIKTVHFSLKMCMAM